MEHFLLIIFVIMCIWLVRKEGYLDGFFYDNFPEFFGGDSSGRDSYEEEEYPEDNYNRLKYEFEQDKLPCSPSSLDEDIVNSHRNYLKETTHLATVGASHATDRDDFTPPVPFYGLPRKAHYKQLGSEKTARVSQSETPCQVMAYKQHNSTGYEL